MDDEDEGGKELLELEGTRNFLEWLRTADEDDDEEESDEE